MCFLDAFTIGRRVMLLYSIALWVWQCVKLNIIF